MEPSPSILDVINALTQRGRVEKAVDFLVNVAILAEEQGVDNLTILKLTIEEYIRLMYPKPLPKIRGRWDTVIYGEAAFR